MPRYIDADELKIDYGFTWSDITPTHEEMYALIDRQPTIDAKPVRRGKWIMDSTFPNGIVMCHCSECEYLKTIFSDEPQINWNYCPHCGANNMVEGDSND